MPSVPRVSIFRNGFRFSYRGGKRRRQTQGVTSPAIVGLFLETNSECEGKLQRCEYENEIEFYYL